MFFFMYTNINNRIIKQYIKMYIFTLKQGIFCMTFGAHIFINPFKTGILLLTQMSYIFEIVLHFEK